MASPETDVRSAPLTRTLPQPVYSTFMAHKYQELSMISLLYYQRRAYRGNGWGTRTGEQNCYLAQFYISCPTPTGTAGTPEFRNKLRAAGLPSIQPAERDGGCHSARALRTILARAQIQSTRPGSSFPGKTKGEGHRGSSPCCCCT